MTVYVINDGSTDDTAKKVYEVAPKYPWLKFLDYSVNEGKSTALNKALEHVTTKVTITIDGE